MAFQRHRTDSAADETPDGRTPSDPRGRFPRPRAEEPMEPTEPTEAPPAQVSGGQAVPTQSGAPHDDIAPVTAAADPAVESAAVTVTAATTAAAATTASSDAAATAPETAAAAAPEAGQPGEPDEPAGPAGPTDQPADHRLIPWPSARQQIAAGIVVLCVGMAIFLLGHRYLPDAGGFGSLIETALPWFAVPALVLLLTAALVRSWRALVAAALVAAIWAGGYGPMLLPRGPGLPGNLRIVSEDVNGSQAELAAMGPVAAAQNADLVALQDVYSAMQTSAAAQRLDKQYRYRSTEYGFGLWSRYPISAATPVSLGTAPDTGSGDESGLAADATHVVIGALRVVIQMPGDQQLIVYVTHIPQPVLTDQGFAKIRDAAIKRLVPIIAADHSAQVVVVGNLNLAATDREFSQFTSVLGLTSAQSAAGRGFGFDWPAEFPVVRLDDVLTRDVTPVRSVVLPEIQGGQTHRPIEVDLHLAG